MRPFALILLPILVLAACGAPAPTATTVPATRGASDALSLASAERVGRGMPALRHDPALAQAAAKQAATMAARGRIGHDGAGGSDVRTRVRSAGSDVCYIAENVAGGQIDAAQVHGDWMGSAGHRRNILNAAMTRGAVAAVRGPRGRMWWAMVLGGPC